MFINSTDPKSCLKITVLVIVISNENMQTNHKTIYEIMV